MAVYHAFRVEDAGAVSSYIHGFTVAPEVFLGTRTFPQYASWYLTIVLATRLLLFAALSSVGADRAIASRKNCEFDMLEDSSPEGFPPVFVPTIHYKGFSLVSTFVPF